MARTPDADKWQRHAQPHGFSSGRPHRRALLPEGRFTCHRQDSDEGEDWSRLPVVSSSLDGAETSSKTEEMDEHMPRIMIDLMRTPPLLCVYC